jgi:hypothetical protein
MSKLESVEKFIESRALGHTFDEIVRELTVSKPTLIKWGKEYENQIKLTERKLAEKLSENIAQRNAKFLEILFEKSFELSTNKNIEDEVKSRIYKRASKKLYKLFKNEMKSLELTFAGGGKIISAKINWEDDKKE